MSDIFEYKLENIYEVLLLESIFIQKEILWRIHFILIEFFLNKILLEKIWNECKNHHFSIRLRVSSRTTSKQKWGVAFLHSRLFTLGGFVTIRPITPRELRRFLFYSLCSLLSASIKLHAKLKYSSHRHTSQLWSCFSQKAVLGHNSITTL